MLSRVILGLGAVVTAATVAGAAPIILPAAIPNGDFQTGTLTGWSVGAGGLVPGASVTVVADAGPGGIGDYAVHTTKIADWQTGFYLNGISGEIGSIKGAYDTTYNITFDVKSGNPAAASTVDLRIERGHWQGIQDFTIDQNGSLLSDGGWHTVTIQYRTGSDGWLNEFGIRTVGFGGAPDHDFYFDNFAVSPVPEPATIGLLGAATLGLLRRRRRSA